MASERRLGLDDFEVGDRLPPTGEYQMTAEAIHDFASAWDPQPIHLDEAAAATDLFGGIVASGWHTASATMRLVVDSRPLGATPLVGVQIDALRFVRPVRAGDRIHVDIEVVGKRRSESRPETGFLRLRLMTRDQTDAMVLTQEWTMLVPTDSPS